MRRLSRILLPAGIVAVLSAPAHSFDLTPTPAEIAAQQAQQAQQENDTVREKVNSMVGKKMIAPPSKGEQLIPQIKVAPDYGSIYRAYLTYTSTSVPMSATPMSVKLPKESKPKQVQHAQSQGATTQPEPVNIGGQQAQQVVQLTGICTFTQTLRITTLQLPVETPCLFKTDTGESFAGTLRGILTPDGKTYSLILVPKEVVLPDGRSLQVVSGYALTADKSSMNLADRVNENLLKRVLLSATEQGISSGFKAYQEYAENKNKQTYVANDNTVATTNQYPSNYPVVSAVLGAVKGAVDAFVGLIKEKEKRVPVIFVVNGGKSFWVSLKVKEGKQ